MVFDPSLPLECAHTIPASWYLREDANLFHSTWQVVGRGDQVKHPGDYFTIDLAGEPLLIVRGDDGILRGFHNVCRHRAALVMDEPCGHATKLRCRYHGWTYDLRGTLRGTPEFENVLNFSKTDNGLPPILVREIGPLVISGIAPTVTLDTAMSPLAADLVSGSAHVPSPTLEGRDDGCEALATLPQPLPQERGVRDLRFHERRSYEVGCNWKVYVDNYLDGGYHVNTVHPALAGSLDYREYTTTIYDWTALQQSPLTDGGSNTRSGGVAQYWWVFPNFMLNRYPRTMDTNSVLPLGPERCRVVFDFYFDDSCDDAFRSESIAVAEQVQHEDMTICESVQRGLKSKSYSTGRFSKTREGAGYHFHKLYSLSPKGERGARRRVIFTASSPACAGGSFRSTSAPSRTATSTKSSRTGLSGAWGSC